jgi:hypothetical protein
MSVTKQDTQGDFERESGEGMKGELVLLIEGSFFSRGNVIRTGFRNPKVNVLSPSQAHLGAARLQARPFPLASRIGPLYEPALGATVLYCEMAGFTIPLKFRSMLELLLIRRLRRRHRSGGRRKGTTHSAVSATTAMLKN